MLLQVLAVRADACRQLDVGERSPIRERLGEGERLALAIDPSDLAFCTQRELEKAFKALVKRLRNEAGAQWIPTGDELYVFGLWRDGRSYDEIARAAADVWPDCRDTENGTAQQHRKRRAIRVVKKINRRLARHPSEFYVGFDSNGAVTAVVANPVAVSERRAGRRHR
jgi:hypothetical protein